MTKIINCECTHEFQDKRYGPGKRVANVTGGKGNNGWRCTVCGKDKSATPVKSAPKK